MPKRRVDRLDGVRIELNEREREMSEAFAYGTGVGEIMKGAGAMLQPFEGAITALTVAWIAEKGINAIVGGAQEALTLYNETKEKLQPVIQKRMEAEGISEQEAFARTMDRELTWWEKITLRAAGYEW